jgi:hypothetical protein
MTVVTNRSPRRNRQKPAAKPVEIAVPYVVNVEKGRGRKPAADDPEAEARVAAFMKRVIRPR